ncbi:hypothetical protein [Mycobacterium sp. M23085]|uniref:hypothetical protein n=1 Tax=Mycobacterium sp. M23085 TaxID=3378087 RepID=UPI00387810FE
MNVEQVLGIALAVSLAVHIFAAVELAASLKYHLRGLGYCRRRRRFYRVTPTVLIAAGPSTSVASPGLEA